VASHVCYKFLTPSRGHPPNRAPLVVHENSEPRPVSAWCTPTPGACGTPGCAAHTYVQRPWPTTEKAAGGRIRYVLDPVDIEAEREVTVSVKRAAAEALAEANSRLKEAEASQQLLTQQLEEARTLAEVLIFPCAKPRANGSSCVQPSGTGHERSAH
jgi:hypothetical protein